VTELSALVLIGFLIYVIITISKIFKEERITTKDILKSIGIALLLIPLPYGVLYGMGYGIGYIVDGEYGASIGKIVGVAIYGIIFLCVCLYGIFCNLKDK